MNKHFQNKRLITDIDFIKKGDSSYKWKPLTIKEGYDVWLQYYGGGKLDNQCFDLKGLHPSLPHAYILIRIGDSGTYNSYEYMESVIVDRKTQNNIRIDVIQNLEEILSNVKELISESENAPE